MAFDNSQPEDTTKIRNLGTVIRPNWVAIEDGDTTFQPKAINFTNRTVSGPSDNPTAIANTYILFCKEDSAGNPELYGINENSNVIQMTKGAPTVSQTGKTFLPGGLILAWGSLSVATGGTVTVSGMTTIYSVALSLDYNSNPATRIATVFGLSGNTFQVYGSNSPTEIHYIAIGV